MRRGRGAEKRLKAVQGLVEGCVVALVLDHLAGMGDRAAIPTESDGDARQAQAEHDMDQLHSGLARQGGGFGASGRAGDFALAGPKGEGDDVLDQSRPGGVRHQARIDGHHCGASLFATRV